MKQVGIVLGSKSDTEIAEKAIGILRQFEIPFEVRILSAHRCPEEAKEYASAAREGGFSVLIAFAGMAAHLAGALAANTTIPVIGVPCKGSCFDGLDALLSTVMMPSGIPVATVAVNGGANAALLAIEMMSIEDASLAEKLAVYREKQTASVLEADKEINAKYKVN